MKNLLLDRRIKFVKLLSVLILFFGMSVLFFSGDNIHALNFSVGIGEDKGNLRLEIPPRKSYEDLITDNREYLEAPDSFASLNRGFSILNQALWVFVAPIFMVVLLYAGYLMITSQGDAVQMKKGINVLIYAGAALGLILLSFVIVNLVVNLF